MAKAFPAPWRALPATFPHGTRLPITQRALPTTEKQRSEKQRSKKPGNSHLRAARRQGRTMLHRLNSHFARRDHGEMKINRVRTGGDPQFWPGPPTLELW